MKNKFLTAAAVLAAASLASAGFSWNGADAEFQIITGLDNGSETAGYWYTYADDADGGLSAVTWPCELGNDYSPDALDLVIIQCGGVCGTYTLGKGTLNYNPFVGIGFNVAGESASGTADIADASSWGGICISYSVDNPAVLELGLGDDKDNACEYDNPTIALPKQATPQETCAPWAKFKQAGWGKGDKVSGEEAAAILASVKFKIQGADGTTGQFNITSVRSQEGSVGIKSVAAASAVKATLSGRTLSFAGIKSVASAEVMNLQGQVMVKGSVSSSTSLDLSSIDAGVYMVRIAGKSVDFSQKIIIK